MRQYFATAVVVSGLGISPLLAAPAELPFDIFSGGHRPIGYDVDAFVEDFNGTEVNKDVWALRKNEAPRHGGINTYDSTSIDKGLDAIGSTDGSILKITSKPPVTHTDGKEYYPTSMIATHKSTYFRYGYAEANVKFQNVPGHWSAFWLQSRNQEAYNSSMGTDTKVNGAEVDIMEHTIKGTPEYPDEQTNHAIHYNGYGAEHKSWFRNTSVPLDNDAWNRFGVLWTPTSYSFYVNGILAFETTTAISQVQQFLILSLEVANEEMAGWGGTPVASAFPDSFLVDYVHVYQQASDVTHLEPEASIPEPASLALLGLGGMLMLRRKRQA